MQRVEKIAAARPKGIILREKDLREEEYKRLAEKVLLLCETYHVPCILHSFIDTATELGAENIHLPLPLLRQAEKEKIQRFKEIGTSCHSVEEAREAETLGCSYITAGHIFATDCKKGLPPRGLDFLRAVSEGVSIPVYAIGGIGSGNIAAVREAGAKGACIMSGLMQCEDVEGFLKALK